MRTLFQVFQITNKVDGKSILRFPQRFRSLGGPADSVIYDSNPDFERIRIQDSDKSIPCLREKERKSLSDFHSTGAGLLFRRISQMGSDAARHIHRNQTPRLKRFKSLDSPDTHAQTSDADHSGSWLQKIKRRTLYPRTKSKNGEKEARHTVYEDDDPVELLCHRSVSSKTSMTKPQRIALEILTTEKHYVQRLECIAKVYKAELIEINTREKLVAEEEIKSMFPQIESILNLHSNFILPQLEARLLDPKAPTKIADIFCYHADFFKLYAEFTVAFPHKRERITNLMKRCPRIEEILSEIQMRPISERLSLFDHLMEIIQRLPRYMLLLKKALDSIVDAAKCANDILNAEEQFEKVLEIQKLLGGAVDLISPTRKLLRRGRMRRICPVTDKRHPKEIFLFTDLLLICRQGNIRKSFIVESSFDLVGLSVYQGDANSFYLRGSHKCVEMEPSDSTTDLEWIKNPIGQVSPIWGKFKDCDNCRLCNLPFSKLKLNLRQKKHCRACGEVVCSVCSDHRVYLAYNGCHGNRTCDVCFRSILDSNAEDEISTFLL
ncbi:hypothetical protein CAPTEDRAFT_204499 [Capitella teleta]|uniref:FYVE-type domain-containing protein n=1 Tax=Capitella teleta TaxID=283909 RepID=R7U3V5_CAPTE|nr:hypothetical protein CAPTEDRAFT_204499 [Capitella teleta]|eukprot:ELT98341.1 hypothetical protein CAPTEDRAFT_204499 [Capitella teleta]